MECAIPFDAFLAGIGVAICAKMGTGVIHADILALDAATLLALAFHEELLPFFRQRNTIFKIWCYPIHTRPLNATTDLGLFAFVRGMPYRYKMVPRRSIWNFGYPNAL